MNLHLNPENLSINEIEFKKINEIKTNQKKISGLE